MEKLINRVGLSWLYDYIKLDLTTIASELTTFNAQEQSNLFKKIDIRLSHLAKVFYLLNIPSGVFFINEFRLSLNFIQIDKQIDKKIDKKCKLNIAVLSNNIENILNYIDDIIQGYGDLLIYYVPLIDELRTIRGETLFSQCSYIVNSVQQQNISAYPSSYNKTQRANINKYLLAITEFYNAESDNSGDNSSSKCKEKLLININAIKNELKGTQHYLLWELIYAYVLLEKNYNLKTTYVISSLLQQILINYNNSLFDPMGFEKLSNSIANWIGTLCFHIIYCDGFQILPQATKDKILKILIIHDRKSLTNYLAFAERMQDTDGWILVLDLASELDLAINRLKDCKRKKRVDLNWLLELLQKHIDSCILTGTYEPLESYYHTNKLINHYVIAGGFISGDDLEAVDHLILLLIKKVELTVVNTNPDQFDQDLLQQDTSMAQINQDAQKALLKNQLSDLESISIAISSEENLTNKFISECLHKIISVFNIISFQPGVNITNLYINKININNNSNVINELISSSLKQNTIVFIKYLSEIIKSLYNNRDFAFHIKAAKKLIDAIDLATIISVYEPASESGSESGSEFGNKSESEQIIFENSASDLVNIFFDEADNIIEHIDIIIAQWSEELNNVELMNSLQRELHTLKGAGRMVNFVVVSDWAHHLEELVDQCHASLNTMVIDQINIIKSGVKIMNNLILAYRQNQTPKMPELLSLTNHNNTSKSDSFNHLISVASILNHHNQLPPTSQSSFPLPLRQMVRIANTDLDSIFDGVCELLVVQHQLAEQMNYYKRLAQRVKTVNNNIIKHECTAANSINNKYHTVINQMAIVAKNFNQLNTKQEAIVNNYDSHVGGVFEKLMDLRMIPLHALRSRLEHLVENIAKDLDKKINLNLIKTDGKVDRIVLEQMTPCLEHLVRNAIDHGIENDNTRRKFNKNIFGKIDLSIYSDDSCLILEISDDGAGIDVEKVRDKAIKLGIITADQELTDSNVLSIICSPNFSTVNNISQISGRGIGLNVVNDTINKLSGIIQLSTKRHHGTKFIIKIPNCLTKQSLLFIKINDLIYALPALIIDEVMSINQEELINKDIAIYNLFDLINFDKSDKFNINNKKEYQSNQNSNKFYNVVIIKHNTWKIGFIVDEIFEARDSIVRPLPMRLKQVGSYLGGTVYKNGKVVLILDLINILNNSINSRNSDSMQLPDADLSKYIDSNKSANILALEDSPIIRQAIEDYLKNSNYNLITAVDGLDGLSKIKLFKPDLILLDLSMPNMDGLQFLRIIRDQVNFKNTPVIIMTSRDEMSYRDEAMQLNVDICLKKPYDKQKLINAIEYVLD